MTQHAAFVASWEQCFADVAKAVGATSAEELVSRAPAAFRQAEAASAELRRQGAV